MVLMKIKVNNDKMQNLSSWKHMIKLVIKSNSVVGFIPITLSMLNNLYFV